MIIEILCVCVCAGALFFVLLLSVKKGQRVLLLHNDIHIIYTDKQNIVLFHGHHPFAQLYTRCVLMYALTTRNDISHSLSVQIYKHFFYYYFFLLPLEVVIIFIENKHTQFSSIKLRKNVHTLGWCDETMSMKMKTVKFVLLLYCRGKKTISVRNDVMFAFTSCRFFALKWAFFIINSAREKKMRWTWSIK